MNAAALRSLGLTRMQAFACRGTYVDNVPAEELAARAGVRTASAIRMRVYRARKKLAAHPNPAVRRLADALNLRGGQHRTSAFALLTGEC
jgi:DNA-directed RNA polymerase specialized sigma24 family protein